MYVEWSHPSGSPTYSTLLTSEVNNMPNVHASLVSAGASVKVYQGASVVASYNFIPTCEPKYTPVKCDFVNKNGAWQRIVFFKASKTSLTVKAKEYNLMSADVDYNVQDNVTQAFNINGTQTITVNTGWVVESYLKTMSELMLSEHIKLDGKPVVLKTKSLEMQESINTKNINYKLEFNYAHSALNYNS